MVRESSPRHTVKYEAVYIYYLGDKVYQRISTQIRLLAIRVASRDGNWEAWCWEWTSLFILYPFVHLNFLPCACITPSKYNYFLKALRAVCLLLTNSHMKGLFQGEWSWFCSGFAFAFDL